MNLETIIRTYRVTELIDGKHYSRIISIRFCKNTCPKDIWDDQNAVEDYLIDSPNAAGDFEEFSFKFVLQHTMREYMDTMLIFDMMTDYSLIGSSKETILVYKDCRKITGFATCYEAMKYALENRGFIEEQYGSDSFSSL